MTAATVNCHQSDCKYKTYRMFIGIHDLRRRDFLSELTMDIGYPFFCVRYPNFFNIFVYSLFYLYISFTDKLLYTCII